MTEEGIEQYIEHYRKKLSTGQGLDQQRNDIRKFMHKIYRIQNHSTIEGKQTLGKAIDALNESIPTHPDAGGSKIRKETMTAMTKLATMSETPWIVQKTLDSLLQHAENQSQLTRLHALQHADNLLQSEQNMFIPLEKDKNKEKIRNSALKLSKETHGYIKGQAIKIAKTNIHSFN